MSSAVIFFVNGRKVVDENVDPEWTLAWYIREKLRLTGTKLACEEGQCGSCTVLLAHFCPQQGKPKYGAVNACLVPVVSVHGCAVTTVEGIGSVRTKLHPVQERLAKGHGTQCGYCTPGFVMSMYSLLRNKPEPSTKEIDNSLQGNLCRCTGYRSIVESFYTFGKKGCGMKKCCQEKPELGDTTQLTNWDTCQAYDPSQDPIFPPELQMNSSYKSDDLTIFGPRVTYYRPSGLKKLLQLVKEHPDAKIIASATLVGLMERYSVRPKATWIATMGVKELSYESQGEDFLEVGAGLTLTDIQNVIEKVVNELPEWKTRVLRGILSNLELLFSVQLRNVASWAGNVSTGSPISDLTVPFLGSGCQLQVTKSNGDQKWVETDENFFTGVGRKVNLAPDELITAGRIPFTHQNEYFLTYKQGLRRGSDSALVNAGFWVQFHNAESKLVSKMRLSFGGMSSRPVLAKIADQLAGKEWDEKLLEEGLEGLRKEFHLPPNSYGGREAYRTSLCLSFFFKFFTSVRQRLEESCPALYTAPLGASEASCIDTTEESSMEATQLFHETPGGQLSEDPVGRPIPHQWGDRHTTGEAEYTPDVRIDNMCYLGIVYSKKAHAKLVSVDPSEAVKLPGVIAYVDAKDIPPEGSNEAGTEMEVGDTVFATQEVTAIGERIGAIVAEDSNVAKRAVQLVKVVYEDLPIVTTIEEAIEKEMFYGEPVTGVRGDAEKRMGESELTLSGEIRIGGQEHMYMETMAALVIPGEGREWVIHVGTQNTPGVQEGARNILGLKKNECVVQVKRVGGAFGGKLSQFNRALWPALVAAEKVRRPVKCVLSRREDMAMTGKRHPGICYYKVGFTKEGKITALDAKTYLDGGHTLDQSLWILPLTVTRMDHVYWLPDVSVIGRACKTNLPSNTGFRGYGTPQGYFFMESIIERIATHLNKPPEMVREMNFLKKGQRGLTDDLVRDDALMQCWTECADFSKFQEKKAEAEAFNQKNRYRKRGVNLFPTRFGVGMAGVFMEQGAALVNVYTDGTVMVSHAGIEMGQGMNVKILQIASRALNLPLDKITILDHGSDKVPNAVVSGGSQGSDVHGLAVKNACEILLKRLEPLVEENPKGTWEEWCMAAFMKSISLSATGFAMPRYDTDDPKEKHVGNPRYYVSGAACTEVEIDCLTGDHKLLSTDIVMDVGDSLNPAIDIGQIEGGFIQGYGQYVTEELIYATKGYLVTDSAGKYKIPTVSTIPQKFRVALLKGNPDKFNLYSSKGIGEPPYALGCSVFCAIKDGINAYRKDQGLSPLGTMDSPATPERIRLACEDQFTRAARKEP